MNHIDHIKNILKDVFRGRIADGQSLDGYLDGRAKQILEYVPGNQEKTNPVEASRKDDTDKRGSKLHG